MSDNFDINSPLVCEGVVGDGCGGGRIFFIKNNILKAHDPVSGKNTTLLEGIKDALSISKKACILSVVCEDKSFEFDLSTMKSPLYN